MLDAMEILKEVDVKDYVEYESPEIDQETSLSIDGLVLAPTREIAIQLFEYHNTLLKHCPQNMVYQSSLLIGGIEIKD